MVQLYDTRIERCILHYVGNKTHDIDCRLSLSEIEVSDELSLVLTNYFFKPFSSKEDYCCFHHNSDLSMNEVFAYASRIFESSDTFVEESKNILRHLYDCSTHPQIKTGELYVAYFTNCLIDGHNVDAIGIFKSEHKESFIKVTDDGRSLNIETQKGININKLDKGCVIYNTNKETGYLVSVVDNSNSGEAKYWTNTFLNVNPRNNSFNQTKNILELSKSFVRQLDCATSSEKAILLNRSMKALDSESITLDSFASQVFIDKEQKNSFDSYSKQYQEDNEINLEEKFVPSKVAVRKKHTDYKKNTTIYLDDAFDICIHGGEGNIEQGYDDMRGQHFYKLYFDKEH